MFYRRSSNFNVVSDITHLFQLFAFFRISLFFSLINTNIMNSVQAKELLLKRQVEVSDASCKFFEAKEACNDAQMHEKDVENKLQLAQQNSLKAQSELKITENKLRIATNLAKAAKARVTFFERKEKNGSTNEEEITPGN